MKQKSFLQYFMKMHMHICNFLKKVVNVDSLKGHDFVDTSKPACQQPVCIFSVPVSQHDFISNIFVCIFSVPVSQIFHELLPSASLDWPQLFTS